MATETRTAHGVDADRDADRDVDDGTWSTATAALRELALFAVAVVWTAFWSNVARLHLVADSMVGVDLANAAFVAVTMVLPAVALYLWHLASRVPVLDVPEPLEAGPIGGTSDA